MARDFAEAFYHSADWKHSRLEALTRDHGLCQHCLARGEVTPAVMVHHIIELTPENIDDPRIALDLRNLVSLCDFCHKVVHGWVSAGRTRPGLAFDENGNLVNLEETHGGTALANMRHDTAKAQVKAASGENRGPPV